MKLNGFKVFNLNFSARWADREFVRATARRAVDYILKSRPSIVACQEVAEELLPEMLSSLKKGRYPMKACLYPMDRIFAPPAPERSRPMVGFLIPSGLHPEIRRVYYGSFEPQPKNWGHVEIDPLKCVLAVARIRLSEDRWLNLATTQGPAIQDPWKVFCKDKLIPAEQLAVLQCLAANLQDDYLTRKTDYTVLVGDLNLSTERVIKVFYKFFPKMQNLLRGVSSTLDPLLTPEFPIFSGSNVDLALSLGERLPNNDAELVSGFSSHQGIWVRGFGF